MLLNVPLLEGVMAGPKGTVKAECWPFLMKSICSLSCTGISVEFHAFKAAKQRKCNSVRARDSILDIESTKRAQVH